MDWETNGKDKSPQQLIVDGLKHYRNRYLSAAMDCWKNAIAADPFNQEALFYLKEAFKEKDLKRVIAQLLGTSTMYLRGQDYNNMLVNALMVRGIDPENQQALKFILIAKDGLEGDLKPLPIYDALAEKQLEREGGTIAQNFNRHLQLIKNIDDKLGLDIDSARIAIADEKWEAAYTILSKLLETNPNDLELQEMHEKVSQIFMKELSKKFESKTYYPRKTGKELFESELKEWDIEDIFIFSLINGKRNIAQLENLVSQGKDKLLPTLFHFMQAGLITLSEKKASKG